MRVGVFIDGQNLTISARHAFGHGNAHPLLLARALTARLVDGRDAELVEVRYATGMPSPDVQPDRHAAQRRRHDLMLATDVVVLEKPLRYRWEWSIRDRSLGSPFEHKGAKRKAKVRSRQRGQEKGIDVWLALDALVMCTRADLDAVVLVTADRDLDIVPDYVRMVPGNEATRVVQARVLEGHRTLRPNPAYDQSIAVDAALFERCRDDFDYAEPLDEDEVARFVARIGADGDGLRD